MPVLHGFAHEAARVLALHTDPAAPGGAVSVALCGHWEHDGPCRWPHNSELDSSSDPAAFRTVFVCEDEASVEVRQRIDAALRQAKGWAVATGEARPLTAPERELALRLGAASDGPRRDTSLPISSRVVLR